MNAKSVLDMLMGAAQQRQGSGGAGGLDLGAILGQVMAGQQGGAGAQQPAQPQGGGGLADILGQVLGGGAGGGRGTPQMPAAPQGGGGLSDILGQVLGGGRGAPQQPPAAPQGGGGLGDLLGGMLGGGRNAPQAPPSQQGGGGLGDLLGSILGGGGQQAPQPPAPQGRGYAQNDTGNQQPSPAGIEEMLRNALGGKGADASAMLEKLKEMIANNPGGAAAAGGLGALILGTKSGRSIATKAAAIGGLAVIGALAYRAYQNWQNGEQPGTQAALETPPTGSGFEGGQDEAEQNNTAMIMIKAMIAAAAADGRIDEAEKNKMLGSIDRSKLTPEMTEFIQYELSNPSDAAGLAQFATTQEIAAQIYTAARMVIDPDTRAEMRFMTELAEGLQLDSELVGHIDAAAANMAG